MRQYFTLITGQYLGEPMSGSEVGQGRKREGEIVSPLDQLVNQQNNNSDYHQK